jgi:nucleotide-binding universal stress UspA family protein
LHGHDHPVIRGVVNRLKSGLLLARVVEEINVESCAPMIPCPGWAPEHFTETKMSHRLQRILVASEFGERSRAAEDFASHLAETVEATLLLVHAIEPIAGLEEASDEEGFKGFYGKLLVQAIERSQERTRAWVDRGIQASHHVEIGNRWRVILAQAEMVNVDLIVMGRRAYGGEESLAIGTTSQKVFFATSRRTLFVPH